MPIDTKLNSHRILDRKYSDNKKDFSYDDYILLNTLNLAILEIKYGTTKNISTEVYDKISSAKNNSAEIYDKIDVNLPNLKSDIHPTYKDYIKDSQNWIGYIIELDEDKFRAKLIDKKDPTTYETAQFDLKEVSDGDLNLVKMGAMFYWSVGYANQRGQISKYSLIRFKRSIDFSVDDVNSIADKINDLNDIAWD